MESQLDARAQDLKLQGNDLYKREQFAQANVRYTNAIKLLEQIQYTPDCDRSSSLMNVLSNRAQSLLKMGDLSACSEDCTGVIRISLASGVKGVYYERSYYARARAFSGLGRLSESIDDFNYMLKLHECRGFPEQAVLKKELDAVMKKWDAVATPVIWKDLLLSQFPPGMSSHTAILHPSNDSLIVYGGLRDGGGTLASKMLRRLTFGARYTGSWADIGATGNIPPKLFDHTAVVHERRMYVFGGVNPDKDRRDALYSLHLDTYRWQALTLPGHPGPLYGHTACVHLGKMYVFGGIRSSKEGARSGLHILDFEDQSWISMRAPRHDTMNAPEWPSSRAFHTAWISHETLMIYGGRQRVENEELSDMWAFDLETLLWSRKCSARNSIQPGPRAHAAAACFDERATYIFGGEHEVQEDTTYDKGLRMRHHAGGVITCTGMNAIGRAPTVRSGATVTMDPTRRRAIVIGGVRDGQLCSDVWEIQVSRDDGSDGANSGGISACASCGVRGTWRKCADCYKVAYCDISCHRKHWPIHMHKCGS